MTVTKPVATPQISDLFASKKPSALRQASVEFEKRPDAAAIENINLAIGNVILPTHPAMRKRMENLTAPGSPFEHGQIQYTSTQGNKDTQQAFLHTIAASGFDTDGLSCQITEGASAAMELMILGVCGDAGTGERPLLLIDASYTNYASLATRVGRNWVTVTRHLDESGSFTMPDVSAIESAIVAHNPGALVVVPSDNPTGQHMAWRTFVTLAELCVKHNMWMVSDEAYRELHYDGETLPTSIWRLNNDVVPGIEGRRISLETASKVWNACGLRIGGMVSDNDTFIEKSTAENMSNLCANHIGQYIFAALGEETKADLQAWFVSQRKYYTDMIGGFVSALKADVPGIIASNPDAALYTVVDVRNVVKADFNARDFVDYCAREGKVHLDGKDYTLLVAPMDGFYSGKDNGAANTQMRLAYVQSPEVMKVVPQVFKELLSAFEASR